MTFPPLRERAGPSDTPFMAGAAASPGEKTKRAHFYAFLAALFLLSAVFLWMVGPYLLSLFFGGLLALLTTPLYEKLRRWGAGPKTAAGLASAFVLILFLGPVAEFGYLAVKQGIVVGRQLSELQEFSPGRLTRMLGQTRAARALADPAEVNARVKEALRSGGMSLTAAVLAVAKGVPQLALQLLLSFVAFFFLLMDGSRLVDFILTRAAFERDVRDKLRGTFADMARSTVLAGFAAAAAQAVLIFVAYMALGVPGAFIAGAGTFFLAWLPVVGTLPAAAAGVAWLVSQDETVRMAVMLAFAAAAGTVDNLVRPLVLKGRSDLHPLLGLVAIVAAIDAFGVLGIFVGPLLAAVLRSLLELWPAIAARYGVEVNGGPGD